MLEVSPLGIGTVLRIERNAWSVCHITMASNEQVRLCSPLPPTHLSQDDSNASDQASLDCSKIGCSFVGRCPVVVCTPIESSYDGRRFGLFSQDKFASCLR